MTLIFPLFLVAVLLLLATGIYSIIVTRNLLRILLSVEVLVKAVTLFMICAGLATGKMEAVQMYIITIIVVEVMVLVVATGMAYSVYKRNGTLDTRKLNNLKG